MVIRTTIGAHHFIPAIPTNLAITPHAREQLSTVDWMLGPIGGRAMTIRFFGKPSEVCYRNMTSAVGENTRNIQCLKEWNEHEARRDAKLR